LTSLHGWKFFRELFFCGRKTYRRTGVRVKKNNVAHKWCKEEKSVEDWEVSGKWTGDFHKVINTCVEILT
jgi:hypothetical protein